jgi:hypothetical protein
MPVAVLGVFRAFLVAREEQLLPVLAVLGVLGVLVILMLIGEMVVVAAQAVTLAMEAREPVPVALHLRGLAVAAVAAEHRPTLEV